MSKKLPAPALPNGIPEGFVSLLEDVKARIRAAQIRAVLAVNAEMVRLYWDIGRMIDERQQREGWGAAVIPRLARELQNEIPEVKGFSERNIKRMLAFYRAYTNVPPIVPQPVAQFAPTGKVPRAVALIPASAGPTSSPTDSPIWLIPCLSQALRHHCRGITADENAPLPFCSEGK